VSRRNRLVSGEVIPRKNDIRDASTFMEFCEHHDREMFRPAEVGHIFLNQEISFLLSFHAIAS
jgi:hypothetical protein